MSRRFSVGVRYQRPRKADGSDGAYFIMVGCEGVYRSVVFMTYVGREAVDSRHQEFVDRFRQLYMIIDRLDKSGREFGLDDVMESFTETLKSDVPADVYRGPIRPELLSVARSFRKDFEYIEEERPAHDASNFLDYILELAEGCKAEGKTSTQRNYVSVVSNLKAYLKRDFLGLDQISEVFVKDYAAWLKQSDCQPSTQSFYLRMLRMALNHASEAGLLPKMDRGFFGLKATVFFEPVRKHDNLTAEDFALIERLDLSEAPFQQVVRDMFCFAFYCRGMELFDVLNLQKDNISGNFLEYKRRGKGLLRRVPLNPKALGIIARYAEHTGPHIFPLLDAEPGANYLTLRGRIGRNLKAIGEKVSLSDLTFSANISLWETLLANIAFLPI